MKDYFIVGFGLAGLTLANELQKRNKSFLVIDSNQQKASQIAGGVINPLILKRFTKAWNAERFIPKAEQVYRDLENRLKQSFFEAVPIYRKIKSVEEQNNWFVAADSPELHAFMSDQLTVLNTLKAAYDFGEVRQTSLLNTKKLLNTFRRVLLEKKQYVTEKFDYDSLEFCNKSVAYKGEQARRIVFCEGVGLLQNPYLKNLPLIGNKGEYLIVKIPGLQLKGIIKTALALIPLGNDYYKFGATYSRVFKNTDPEPESRAFLIKKLEEIIDRPYSVVAREVGVRPTVSDRRPLLGQIPKYDNMFVFNGLGSHGVMIAPTAAGWLLDSIHDKKNLPEKVDVQRYFKG